MKNTENKYSIHNVIDIVEDKYILNILNWAPALIGVWFNAGPTWKSKRRLKNSLNVI